MASGTLWEFLGRTIFQVYFFNQIQTVYFTVIIIIKLIILITNKLILFK